MTLLGILAYPVSVFIACVASVPVRSERNSGRAKEFFTFGKGTSPPPPPSFHLFALAPFFARPECEKLTVRGPSFVRFVLERLLRRLVCSVMKLLPFLLFSKQESMLFTAQRQYLTTVHKARLAVLAMYVGAKIDADFAQREMRMNAVVV